MVAVTGKLDAIKRRVGPHMIRSGPVAPKGIQKPGGGSRQGPKLPNTGGVRRIPSPKGKLGNGGVKKRPPFTGTGHLYGANPPKGGVPKALTPLQAYLKGDATYLQQLAGFNKTAADFRADQNLDRAEYMRGYGSTNRDLQLSKTQSSKDIRDEYAGRGILQSGIYNTAFGDMSRKYMDQFTDLNNQKTGFLSRLTQELGKFTNEQAMARQQAIADAARRRAEKLNL